MRACATGRRAFVKEHAQREREVRPRSSTSLDLAGSLLHSRCTRLHDRQTGRRRTLNTIIRDASPDSILYCTILRASCYRTPYVHSCVLALGLLRLGALRVGAVQQATVARCGSAFRLRV